MVRNMSLSYRNWYTYPIQYLQEATNSKQRMRNTPYYSIANTIFGLCICRILCDCPIYFARTYVRVCVCVSSICCSWFLVDPYIFVLCVCAFLRHANYTNRTPGVILASNKLHVRHLFWLNNDSSAHWTKCISELKLCMHKIKCMRSPNAHRQCWANIHKAIISEIA